MATQDEEIARHLREAAASGELSRIPGYGKPLPEDVAWEATPEEFRLPFKILKNAGFAPPEVALFHERAELLAALEAERDPAACVALRQKLAEVQQRISLRLEAMRSRGSV